MKSPHRFTIGQRVEMSGANPRHGMPSGTYTGVRLLPNDSRDREYVVRSKSETHERVVPESMLRALPAGLTERVFA